ncbi:uncharacterized protein LOC143235633 [Tachypleus tridentatus]|uniref:uncharacterized protein LOC143235633 n=1 Tax=Tachypleus tridentatus TaxID=6853 RepID=UPI003FD04485
MSLMDMKVFLAHIIPLCLSIQMFVTILGAKKTVCRKIKQSDGQTSVIVKSETEKSQVAKKAGPEKNSQDAPEPALKEKKHKHKKTKEGEGHSKKKSKKAPNENNPATGSESEKPLKSKKKKTKSKTKQLPVEVVAVTGSEVLEPIEAVEATAQEADSTTSEQTTSHSTSKTFKATAVVPEEVAAEEIEEPKIEGDEITETETTCVDDVETDMNQESFPVIEKSEPQDDVLGEEEPYEELEPSLQVELPEISKWEREDVEDEEDKASQKQEKIHSQEKKNALPSDVIQRAEKVILHKPRKAPLFSVNSSKLVIDAKKEPEKEHSKLPRKDQEYSRPRAEKVGSQQERDNRSRFTDSNRNSTRKVRLDRSRFSKDVSSDSEGYKKQKMEKQQEQKLEKLRSESSIRSRDTRIEREHQSRRDTPDRPRRGVSRKRNDQGKS